MLRRHQGVPDRALRRVLDHNDRQLPHPSRLVGDPPRRGNRRRWPAPRATPAPRACPRQPDPPGALQSPQRRQAPADLRPTARVEETELLAHPCGKTRAMQLGILPDHRFDPLQRRSRVQSALDLMLCVHQVHDTCAIGESPVLLVGHG